MIEVKSFGIIPIFRDGEDIKIVIVKNKNGDHWGLPKGTPEGDELPIETAQRETTEETGIKDFNISEEETFVEKYNFEARGNVYSKTNIYYLGFVNEISTGEIAEDIEEVKWVSFDEARKILTHQTAKGVVNEVENYLKSR